MNRLERMVNNYVSHYNHDKYWKMKEYLCGDSKNKFLRAFYVYRMRKSEAFNGASLGTRIWGGSSFLSRPHFPHGIKGIFITDKARIGKNCTIFQQVTIGVRDPSSLEGPWIGDDVLIGAGALIIGNIRIGSRVRIGAGAIVTKDIPDDATVVMDSPRVILRK